MYTDRVRKGLKFTRRDEKKLHIYKTIIELCTFSAKSGKLDPFFTENKLESSRFAQMIKCNRDRLASNVEVGGIPSGLVQIKFRRLQKNSAFIKNPGDYKKSRRLQKIWIERKNLYQPTKKKNAKRKPLECAVHTEWWVLSSRDVKKVQLPDDAK
jgi:hypothetical protein